MHRIGFTYILFQSGLFRSIGNALQLLFFHLNDQTLWKELKLLLTVLFFPPDLTLKGKVHTQQTSDYSSGSVYILGTCLQKAGYVELVRLNTE